MSTKWYFPFTHAAALKIAVSLLNPGNLSQIQPARKIDTKMSCANLIICSRNWYPPLAGKVLDE